MKITNEHYIYWLQNKSPVPRWESERRAPYKAAPVSVHGLINRQVAFDHRLEAYNLLNAMKREVARGYPVANYLERFLEEWGGHAQYKRRAGYARKWLKRLNSCQ